MEGFFLIILDLLLVIFSVQSSSDIVDSKLMNEIHSIKGYFLFDCDVVLELRNQGGQD